MDESKRIKNLEERIAVLPKGSVSTKNVKGRAYHYRRWSEGGKLREKYVPEAELEAVLGEIAVRKGLEAELEELNRSREPEPEGFRMAVYRGEALRRLSVSVAGLRKRDCFRDLMGYLEGSASGRVLVLCGLRRTGKTTLIRQALASMDSEELSKAAFIQASSGDSLADAKHDMDILMSEGAERVFIDEATAIDGFIDGASLFSDIYAAMGMRIVLSGMDSLGFSFAEDEQLYDRCIMVRTTFIPYREFERVFGVAGIDEYIRYGGTMCMSGARYNRSPFGSKESADAYVDSAIACNIQHSLCGYRHGGHFDHLRDLYDTNELTSVINRVVEDMNHRFALGVLTRDFESHDLGISASNLLRDREHPSDALYAVDRASVTERLRRLLVILNGDERERELTDAHVTEIKKYLGLLDLVKAVDVVRLPFTGQKLERTLVAQPGLRYSQAEALIRSLMDDASFADLPLNERSRISGRILDEVRGRMMEDIVLLETMSAHPEKEVLVARFAIGEFDMVVFDPGEGSCEVFEVKHSAERTKAQRRHLEDAEKISLTEHRYGPVRGKYVIYRGEDAAVDGIMYLNVEGYLKRIAGLSPEERQRPFIRTSCRSCGRRRPSPRSGTCRSAPSPP